jgi:peptidoglycan lytic transglycosylase G
VSAGPPPVPGGRTPEEREAARRERAARRAARTGSPLPPPPAAPDPAPTASPEPTPAAAPTPAPADGHDSGRDWLADAERLTAGRDPVGAGAATAAAGEGGRRARRRGAAVGGSARRPWGRLLALALLALVLAGAAWFANALLQPFAGDGEGSVRVVVPQGATLGDIADLLEREGVIESASFFELRARLSGRSGDLKPGPYELRQEMSYGAVLDRLEEGVPPNVVLVTVPEGRSRAEVAPLVKRLDGNYLRATRRHPALDPRDYRARGATSLEGFLFPATYELKKGQPVRRLVGEQIAAFKENFDRVDLSYARSKNLTPFDVLTIASLVEREAAVAKERPLIASVIYNRLKNDIRLDIDATTRFAVGNWSSPLKVSELQNPSPYNTRVHSGLPPGPIGSPGLDSIKAAARPARTDYLFYVAVICGEGKHRFAETDAEFQRYVAEYEAERERRGGEAPTHC